MLSNQAVYNKQEKVCTFFQFTSNFTSVQILLHECFKVEKDYFLCEAALFSFTHLPLNIVLAFFTEKTHIFRRRNVLLAALF